MKNHGGNRQAIGREFGIDSNSLLDFSANINPLGISESVRQSIESAINDITDYPDSEYHRLIEAIAKHHQLDQQYILPGNGEAELIYLLASSLKPKKVLLLAPTFSEYEEAFSIVESDFAYLKLSAKNHFKLEFDTLMAMLKHDPTIDCLCLCNPNNPTGQLIPKNKLVTLLQYCETNQLSLIIDEAFIDFISNNLEHSLITEIEGNKGLYILRSLTKFYAIPGLRLGYVMTSNREVLKRMKVQQVPWSINTIAAVVGEKIFDDARYATETLELIETQREFLQRELRTINKLTVYPSCCNYLLFKVDEVENLQEKLLRKQVLIRSCANYHGLDETYYRIAVRSHSENNVFLNALKSVMNDE